MCGSSVHCGAAEASGSSTCRRGSVQIPLGGTDHTLSADPGLRPSPLRPRESPTSQRTSSGRVRDPVRSVKWNLARPRPTRLCRSLVGCGRVVSKFHLTDPRTLSAIQTDKVRTCRDGADKSTTRRRTCRRPKRSVGLVRSGPCSGI